MTEESVAGRTVLAFVCVQNAGRSQMATAFAERERERRGWGDRVAILTGGTHPADEVHPIVVEAMGEEGFDLADRTPREVDPDELVDCDVVCTMGCSTLDLGDGAAAVELRDGDLDDPHGKPLEDVRAIRATVERRVVELFDDLDGRLQAE